MNATITELARTAQRLKREMVDEQAHAYAFRHGEEWNDTLRTLPYTCRLWRAFRTFDEARTAYEMAQDARQAVQRELTHIGQRIDEAARDSTVDDDTWMRLEARGRRLELVLKDPYTVLPELKTAM